MPTLAQIQRLTDAAVAEAMAAGTVPLSHEQLDKLVATIEVAAHLAERAGQGVANVLAFSGRLCARRSGGLRPILRREAERQLCHPGLDLVLHLNAGADRDGILRLLDRVRAEVAALPPGQVLGHLGVGLRESPGRRSVTLEAALAIVRRDESARTEIP